VEDGGKAVRKARFRMLPPLLRVFPLEEKRKAAAKAPIRCLGVRNRLPARIFTVDIQPGGRKIPSDQVSRLSHDFILSSPCALGTKETCEEKL
jgi:hypothetical protein